MWSLLSKFHYLYVDNGVFLVQKQGLLWTKKHYNGNNDNSCFHSDTMLLL